MRSPEKDIQISTILVKVISVMETVKQQTDFTEKLAVERRLDGSAFSTKLTGNWWVKMIISIKNLH